ncbi:MAG: hypothetical protein H7235_01480 [Bdellovibrionaceae bacterium]|nr:hypothetical protein [Pseudobdellovibrionaceae bacterium]
MKSLSIHSLIFTLLVSFLWAPLAQAAVGCTVPVCDIPLKISELRLSTREERAAYYTLLSTQYKTNRDPAILSNLIDFSLAAYDLSIQLDKEEEWVPQLTVNLLDRSLMFGLTQNPLDGASFGRWFGLFLGDSASAYRFQTLLYWQNQLSHERLTTAAEFHQLIVFMGLANTAAINLNDEDYVSALTQTISTEAGLQMMRLAPYVEGVYNVQATCQAVDATLCPKINKLSLIFGDKARGIQAMYIDSSAENPTYEFTEVKLVDETTIYGETGPMDVPLAPGSFRIVFDKVNNTFQGVLRTPRTQIEVQLKGQRIVSPDELYQKTLPSSLIPIDQIQGYYVGHIMTTAGAEKIVPGISDFSYVITRYGDNSFKATMRELNTKSLVWDFPASYYFKNLGVITAYTANNYGMIKITWVYRVVNGAPTWLGFAQSLRTGQYFYLGLSPKAK